MLTIEQKKIIKHKRGPAVVTAGPGTGKTHVLCHRVKHRTNRGDPAEKIVVLTFSKSAAKNMETKLEEQFDVDNVVCSTTHAFGLSIIMDYWPELGFSAKPKVKTKLLNKRLAFIVKKVATQNKIPYKTLQNAVYRATKEGKSSSQIKLDPGLYKAVAEVLKRYKNGKLARNWVDFADMLNLPTQLLKDDPDIMKKVGANIRHLLVDEVQDFSEKECQLIYYLAKYAKSAVLVGDTKQSIYGFRGASPKCLRKLERYLKPIAFHLTQSFRVPRQMLGLVNAIGADVNDDPKLTSNRQGFNPRFFRSANNDEQSDFVVREITKLLDRGVPAKEIAILGRTKRPLILLKNALTKNGIEAVERYGEAKEIPVKVLKALMLIAKWKARAPKQGKHRFTPINALTRVLKYSGLPEKVQQELLNDVCNDGWDSLSVPKKMGDKPYRTILALRRAVEKAATMSPESGTQLLIDALKPMMGKRFGNREKLLIVRDFSFIKTAVRGFKTWADVVIKKLPTTYYKTGIELTTCHGAKGREWQYVFLINVVEGEFPFYLNKDNVKLDEELRLLYVAASRTSKKLFIVESPVHKFIYTRGRQKHDANLDSESTFITDYGSQMKVVN
jgi:DNA helicase II / ATP-dependent DNA helicase PcrA